MQKKNELRLNKFLAERLGISRRAADEIILTGRVTIDGKKAELGARVAEKSEVICDGKKVNFEVNFTYLAVNKPIGYVCSKRRQGKNPTIYELLPNKYRNLKTAGRLDCDSQGLILLTDDGDFAYQMTHPSFAKEKQYLVELDRVLEPLHHQMIDSFGITLKDGLSKMRLIKEGSDGKEWRVIIYEGRNRQIRRTFGALGYTVVRLKRLSFGSYILNNLAEGDFQEFRPPKG